MTFIEEMFVLYFIVFSCTMAC